MRWSGALVYGILTGILTLTLRVELLLRSTRNTLLHPTDNESRVRGQVLAWYLPTVIKMQMILITNLLDTHTSVR